MNWGDARLEELQFLSKVDREGRGDFGGYEDSPKKQMVTSLLLDGYLNDGFERLKHQIREFHFGDLNLVPGMLEMNRIETFVKLLKGEPQTFWISHKGRVRVSELRQQLRTGRDRDETGLLWAKRHFITDLAVAILSAGPGEPLCLVMLDMNGLKLINDTHGHAAGDEAIKKFFRAVVETFGQNEAYRNGGDEVAVILPGVIEAAAGKLLDGFVRNLGKDLLIFGDSTEARLTAACGGVCTTNPNENANELFKRADAVQYRAKEASKKTTSRQSAFAVGDGQVETLAPAAS